MPGCCGQLAGETDPGTVATQGGGPMAAPTAVPSRLALGPEQADRTHPEAAWWPESRSLNDELGRLVELWPPDQGRIMRVLYSPPDWDDHPRKVLVGKRRMKTGSFPEDDTHQVTLSMARGERRVVAVIPPGTEAEAASEWLARVRQ